MHLVEEQLCRAWPPERWADLTVLAAVSGGADSVALLRAMTAVRRPGRGRIIVAHLNHRLRGAQSDADAAFVSELCARLGIQCHVGAIDVSRLVRGGEGLEAAARRARYQFLAIQAASVGARYVALGHTADDQAETILHRIIRGTGIAGLAGMPQARPLMLPLALPGPDMSVAAPCRGRHAPQGADDGATHHSAAGTDERLQQSQATGGNFPTHPGATLIRPLLSVQRSEIIEYLQWLGQSYCQDQSNMELSYARNKIRQQLLPWLAAEFNPAVSQSLLRLGTLAREVQELMEPMVEELYSRAVQLHDARRASVDRWSLCGQPRYLVREVLMAVWRRQGWPMQAMGFQQWEALADMLLDTDSATTSFSRTFPGNVQAELAGDQLRLGRLGKQ